MTTIDRSPAPRNGPDASSNRRAATWALILGLLAYVVFGYDLRSELHSVDESAFISQSYFLDLYLKGETNDPAWLSDPAIDLPPLPKYLAGVMLLATDIADQVRRRPRRGIATSTSALDLRRCWWRPVGPRCSSEP